MFTVPAGRVASANNPAWNRPDWMRNCTRLFTEQFGKKVQADGTDRPFADGRRAVVSVTSLAVLATYAIAVFTSLIGDIPTAFLLRASLTLIFVSVFALLAARQAAMAMKAFAALLIPQKILVNQELLLGQVTVLETFVLVVAFLARPVRQPTFGFLPIALFLGLVFVSFVSHASAENSLTDTLRVIAVVLLFYVAAPRMTQREAMDTLETYVKFVLLFCVLCVLTYDFSGLDRLGDALSLNSNNAASFSAMGLIASVFCLKMSRANRQVFWLALAACAVVLLFAGSRTFVLASLIGILVVNNPLKSALTIGLVGVWVLGVLSFVAFDGSGVLFQFTKGLETGSLEEISTKRWLLSIRALEIYAEAPFWGTGLGSSAELVGVYREATDKFLPIHNVYLLYLVELGAMGPLLILLWNFTLIAVGTLYRRVLCVAFTLAFMTSGVISGTYFDPEYGVLWSVSTILSVRQRGERSQ